MLNQDPDHADSQEQESAWDRFWSNLGEWVSDTWENLTDFFDSANEAGECVKTYYNDYTTYEFRDGSTIQVEPIYNSGKMDFQFLSS